MPEEWWQINDITDYSITWFNTPIPLL